MDIGSNWRKLSPQAATNCRPDETRVRRVCLV